MFNRANLNVGIWWKSRLFPLLQKVLESSAKVLMVGRCLHIKATLCAVINSVSAKYGVASEREIMSIFKLGHNGVFC